MIENAAVSLGVGVAASLGLGENLFDSLIAESIHFYSVDAAAGISNVVARVGTLESRGAWKERRSIKVAGRFDRRRNWIYPVSQDWLSDPNSDHVAIGGGRFRLAATRGPLTHASSDRGV